MRRLSLPLTGLLIALTLGGCSLLPKSDVAFDTRGLATSTVESSAGVPTGGGVTQTVLPSGATVRLASGLGVTVPKGWSATLTRDDSERPELHGAMSIRNASELLELQQGTMGHRVRISSSPDPETEWLTQSPYRPVVVSADATAFEVASGPVGIGPRLAVVRTHAEGAEYGLMVFMHTGGTTAKSVEGVWRLFKINGVDPPVSPALGR